MTKSSTTNTLKKLSVQQKDVLFFTKNNEDYISLTDIAKYKNPKHTGLVISHWLSTKFTVEFMGLWEKIHNNNFNVTEFSNIKNDVGSNIQMKSLVNGNLKKKSVEASQS